jgi:hypothetical protein
MTMPNDPVDLLNGARHCDDYIDDYWSPMVLRWFLFINRLPASEKILCLANGVNPVLFATYEGKTVRVVMASRLGDVGITSDLKAELGYEKRVTVDQLGNFRNSLRKR